APTPARPSGPAYWVRIGRTSVASLDSLHRPGTPNRGPGSFGFGTPEPTVRWRRTGLPGSWRTLVPARSVLRPRRDRSTRPIKVQGRGPHVAQVCGLPRAV